MDVILQQHSSLVRRLRQGDPNVTVHEIEAYLDRILDFLKTVPYRPTQTDGLSLLTVVCDDLASQKTLHLFNHPIIINHSIFVYIGRTLEMLLTKCNHLQSLSLKKHDEDALYSISYLIAQLCLHRNEHIPLFYGRFLDRIFPVTEKPNGRDDTFQFSPREGETFLTDKPNLKTARLHPSAPKARPVTPIMINFEIMPEPKQRQPSKPVTLRKDPLVKPQPKTSELERDLPVKTYQSIFLTKSFFEKLRCGIEDLSQNEYSPYHIKYKVIDRLVRLCSKMNLVDFIYESIIKCLCSKFYSQTFTTIESTQMCLTPKQLFFVYSCSRFIIRHELNQPDRLPKLLCPSMIAATKLIIDHALPDHDDRGLARQTLSFHLELLNHLSSTTVGRRHFLQSSISNQMIRILNTEQLLTLACKTEVFFDANVRVIVHTLLLLCNLAYEKTIFTLLKGMNLKYTKVLDEAKDSAIQFAYNALESILSEDTIDEANEPQKLKQDYLKSLIDNLPEAKRITIIDYGRTYE
ncbi:unnamed protein product, partial [Adineta ricciae]